MSNESPAPADDSPTGPLSPGQPFGPRYHIVRLLGIGGMGAVYQAWDAELGVVVAVKVIRPEVAADPAAAAMLERRFKQELLLARQVTHKNVVRIHDLGEIDGIKFITMPFIEGEELATIIRRQDKLPIERVMRIARGIATGLEAAHAAGVVHRDLKPANIMVDKGDEAMIMDFGIARSTGGPNPMPADVAAAFKATAWAVGQTMVGAVVGTVQYMAPEQARAEPVDQRADIYAFGLIVYDMLLNQQRARGADTAIAELTSRMQSAPPAPRSIDPSIPEPSDRLVAQCIEPDAAKRFQTTPELVAALGRAGRPREPAAGGAACHEADARRRGGGCSRCSSVDLFARQWGRARGGGRARAGVGPRRRLREPNRGHRLRRRTSSRRWRSRSRGLLSSTVFNRGTRAPSRAHSRAADPAARPHDVSMARLIAGVARGSRCSSGARSSGSGRRLTRRGEAIDPADGKAGSPRQDRDVGPRRRCSSAVNRAVRPPFARALGESTAEMAGMAAAETVTPDHSRRCKPTPRAGAGGRAASDQDALARYPRGRRLDPQLRPRLRGHAGVYANYSKQTDKARGPTTRQRSSTLDRMTERERVSDPRQRITWTSRGTTRRRSRTTRRSSSSSRPTRGARQPRLAYLLTGGCAARH